MRRRAGSPISASLTQGGPGDGDPRTRLPACPSILLAHVRSALLTAAATYAAETEWIYNMRCANLGIFSFIASLQSCCTATAAPCNFGPRWLPLCRHMCAGCGRRKKYMEAWKPTNRRQHRLCWHRPKPPESPSGHCRGIRYRPRQIRWLAGVYLQYGRRREVSFCLTEHLRPSHLIAHCPPPLIPVLCGGLKGVLGRQRLNLGESSPFSTRISPF